MDDAIKSLGLGLALGLVLLAVLTAFPGEPFDYDSSSNKTISSSDGTKKREAYDTKTAADTPRRLQTPPASPCSHPVVDAGKAASPISNPKAVAAQRNDAEKERQKEKIRKLQTLLGLEKHKMDELVARTEADASATTCPASSSTSTSFSATSTYGGYLDVAFYFLILAALVYVLESEYEVNVLHLAAHLFPREVETATQVLSTPMRWFSQFTGATTP